MFYVYSRTGAHVTSIEPSGPQDYATLASYRDAGHAIETEPRASAPNVAPVAPSAPSAPDVVQRRAEQADRADWTTQVHPDDRASAERDAATLRAMGLEPGRTLFAPGMPLVRAGLDKWNVEHRALLDAPALGEASADVRAAIAGEHRGDATASLSDVRLTVDSDGRLRVMRASRPGVAGLRIERNGLRALVQRSAGTLPGFGFVETMKAPEIADLWNARIARFASPDATIKVRARKALDGNGYSAYAIVTPSYQAHDCDAVAGDVAAVLGTSARGALVYDPNAVSLTWDVGLMRDVPPVVGEVWKVFHRGSTRDDGTSSVYSGGGYLRVLCCNLTTETLETDSSRKRHVGASMADAVRTMIAADARAILQGFEGFGDRWALLARTPSSAIKGPTIADAIGALVDGRPSLREASGIKRDALVEALLRNVRTEGAATDGIGSLADVVNAVTRMHESRLPVATVRAIEADAGALTRDLATLAEAL